MSAHFLFPKTGTLRSALKILNWRWNCTLHFQENITLFVPPLPASNGLTSDRRTESNWSNIRPQRPSHQKKKKKRNQVNSKNYWELKKRLCVRLLKVINTSWENLHIASKAHISMAFAPLTRLICASRCADFLRWCLSPWSTRPWPKRLAKVNFKATSKTR